MENIIGVFGGVTIVAFLVLAILFGDGRDPVSALKNVRVGVGGKFRRATSDDWANAVGPLEGLARNGEEVLGKQGLNGRKLELAGLLEERCLQAEEANFSFARKRDARQFRAVLAASRNLAERLRSEARLMGPVA